WRQCRPTTSEKARPNAGGTGQSAAQYDLAGMGAAGADVSVLAGEGPDEDGGCGHADPPRSQPSGDRGSDEAGQDRGEGGEGQHPARPVRGHAAVLEDRG